MADEHEILKYSFDITDVEAKAQRILELQQQIATAKGKGEQTTELESQLNREIDGLGKLGTETKKTTGATEDLVRQKDKLAGVTRVLGARFGGMIGDLGGVVELLMQGGKAAVAFGGALAGVSAGVILYQKLKQSITEAIEEQEKLNAAVAAQQEARLGTQGQMDVALGQFGLRTAEGSQAAAQLHRRLGTQYGIGSDEAAGMAPLGVAAGLGAKDTGLLLMLQQMGLTAEGPEQARDLLGKVRGTDVGQEARRRLGGIRMTASGMDAQALAEQGRGGFGARTPTGRLFRTLPPGEMPEGVESEEDLRKLLDQGGTAKRELQEAEEERDRQQEAGVLQTSRQRARLFKLKRQVAADEEGQYGGLQKRLDREQRRERGELGPVTTPGSPTTQAAGVQADTEMQRTIRKTVNVWHEHIGTVYNVGAKKLNPRRPNSGMTLSETAIQKMPH